MKRTIAFTLAGLLIAALTACDSSDPVLSSEMSGDVAGDVSFEKTSCAGSIPLAQSVSLRLIGPNATSGGTTGSINGKIRYAVGPSPVLIHDMFSVSLKFEAEIEAFDGTNRTWNFSGNSTDQIAILATDPGFFLKEYQAPGQTAQSPVVTLYVEYSVDGCNVAVHNMWAVEGGLRTSGN